MHGQGALGASLPDSEKRRMTMAGGTTMQNVAGGQSSKGSGMPIEKSARTRNHQNHGPMRMPHRDLGQYTAVIRDGQGPVGAQNKGELAMASANGHDRRVAETYRVER